MAKALKGPLQSAGGTATGVNQTGKDMLGKTGTTEYNDQLWLVAATTKVAGAYWVGNVQGHVDFRKVYPCLLYTSPSPRDSMENRVCRLLR